MPADLFLFVAEARVLGGEVDFGLRREYHLVERLSCVVRVKGADDREVVNPPVGDAEFFGLVVKTFFLVKGPEAAAHVPFVGAVAHALSEDVLEGAGEYLEVRAVVVQSGEVA